MGDFALQKGKQLLAEPPLTPTHILHKICQIPESWWAGNTVSLWEDASNRREKQQPYDDTIFPTFASSFSGSWDPPAHLPRMTAPPGLPAGRGPMRMLEGLKVGLVRSSAASIGEATREEEAELQRVRNLLGNLRRTRPNAFLVYFSFGTQGVRLTPRGFDRILRDLRQVTDIIVYFVLPALSHGTQWKPTLDMSENQRIQSMWETRMERAHMLAKHGNFIITSFAPQPHVMKEFSGPDGRMIMVNSCGAGSLNEAIDTYTPIIGMPYQTDQPSNSRLVQDSGAGIDRSNIVDQMKASGDFLVPYGAIGKLLPWMGKANIPLKSGTGATLTEAINHMRENWSLFKRGVATLKAQRDRNTFSQDEVAQTYKHILLHRNQIARANQADRARLIPARAMSGRF